MNKGFFNTKGRLQGENKSDPRKKTKIIFCDRATDLDNTVLLNSP